MTHVKIKGEFTTNFPVSLSQRSTLSPYLFTFDLDVYVFTKHMQESIPWPMFSGDDKVLVRELRMEIDKEVKDADCSDKSWKHIECKLNMRHKFQLKGENRKPYPYHKSQFKYLGSIIQKDGKMEGGVYHRIEERWMIWRRAFNVINDKKQKNHSSLGETTVYRNWIRKT